MIFHQYPFHLDNVNYRLVVASRLVLECWLDPHWREVPAAAMGVLLQQLVARDATLGAGFLHTITYRHYGMRLEVNNPRWRRWLRVPPQVFLQVLDLEDPYPWVDVDPAESIDEIPILASSRVVVYQTSHLAGLWGIWAALTHQGYLPFPWHQDAPTAAVNEDN